MSSAAIKATENTPDAAGPDLASGEEAAPPVEAASASFLRDRLREKFPGASGQWLDGLILTLSPSSLSVSFAHLHFARWFRDKKKGAFEKALRELPDLPPLRLLYSWPDETLANEATQTKPLPPAEETKNASDPFENFFVNEKNLLPLEAARRVAQDLAMPSPLLFCGPSGVGKTHILGSILDSLAAHGGFSSLHDAKDFFEQDLMAAGCEKFWEGRKALLLDDIQTVRGHEAREEQLAALVDAAMSCPGRCLILTLLGKAGDVGNFGARLSSRLEGGLVAELALPDLDVRLRYLEQLARAEKIRLGKEQALFIARRASGFRQLRGLLARADLLKMTAEKNPEPGALDLLVKTAGRPATSFDGLLAQAARAFKVGAEDILGASRKPDLVLARQSAMYLCRKKLGLSFPELGKAFRRDHSTVIHGIRKIEELVKTDKVLHNLLLEIENAAI